MSAISAEELAASNTDERATHFPVQDVPLPGGGGTMALVTLDNGEDYKKPNTLGPNGLLEAKKAFEECQHRAAAGEIQAVGVTGKPFIFAAGADLSEVGTISNPDQARAMAELGHNALRILGEMDVPTFAFINGLILGGGLEVALHCDYRTVTPGVPAAALPEVFLGLVPGWGGVYILPRLIGPEKAFKVILENPLQMNRMLKGPELLKLGIADVSFDSLNFLEESLAWAGAVVRGEKSPDRKPVDLDDEGTWNFVCDFAKGLLDMKVGGPEVVPAAYRAIELVRAARTATRDEAFAAEDDALTELIMSDQFRSGIYAFNLTQYRSKKPAGAPDKELARDVKKVGIVGAGLMASQLALLFVRRMKVPVVMTDLDADRVEKGVGFVHAELQKLHDKGRLSGDKLNRLKALVTGTTDKQEFADADFVIEAVFEEMSVKQQVFADVEAVVSPECILATNTSSLNVAEMGKDLKHPERLVGFHFFNPVAVMPLLEIARTEHSDDASVATAFLVGKKLKKTCILVKDSTSFVVNRLLGVFMGEVGRLADEGVSVEHLDQCFLGLAPMPPFQLIGLVGPTIALHNSESLNAAFGDRFYVSDVLRRTVEQGIASFYEEQDGQQVLTDQAKAVLPEATKDMPREQVREQVLSTMAKEIGLMLDEGVVEHAEDIDLAMITGAGFSFWNGGICPLLDRTGLSEKMAGRRFLEPGKASPPQS